MAGHVWAGLDVEVASQRPWRALRVDGRWSPTYDDGALVTSTDMGYSGSPHPRVPVGEQLVSAG